MSGDPISDIVVRLSVAVQKIIDCRNDSHDGGGEDLAALRRRAVASL